MALRQANKRFQHDAPIDNFWMVGGLPSSKLKELERNWQNDTDRLMAASRSKYEENLEAVKKELNSNLATEKQLKDIYATQNEELQRRLMQLKEEGHEKSAATKLKEKEKEIQHKKELKIQAQEMAEQFEVEKKEALEQQRADFLLELKARDNEIDHAFAQDMKTTVEHLKREHEHNLNWRLTELQTEGDKQIEELTEGLREALRGGTPIGWLRV